MRNSIGILRNQLVSSGRVFYHEKSDTLYMNWSGAAVEFAFAGDRLEIEFVAMAGIEYEGMPGDTTAPSHENWPFIAVSVDGAIKERIGIEEASKKISIEAACDGVLHKVRIIKLTENLKTELGIRAIDFEGEITKVDVEKRPRIEFIGDSITCGFGNMVSDRPLIFYTKDEDQTNAHGYLAAKELGYDYSIVSISGICTALYDTIPIEYGMSQLYPYTDRVIEEKLDGAKAEAALEKYDFETNSNDYVVLNLGTNDGSAITFAKDPKAYLEMFYKNYRNMIEVVRECNGKNTYIVCALGTMGYYVYSDIEKIVARYKEETGDQNISCFRYVPLNIFDGVGTGDHPCKATHEKMSKEIVAEIRRIEKERG